MTCYKNRIKAAEYIDKINLYRKKNNDAKDIDQQLATFAGNVSRRRNVSNKDASFGSLISGCDKLIHDLQEADLPPTEQVTNAVKKLNLDFPAIEKKWLEFESKNLIKK